MWNKYIINHSGKIEKINDYQIRNGKERINGVYYDRVVILRNIMGCLLSYEGWKLLKK